MSLIGRGSGWGGRLFGAGYLLTFSAFRMGAYFRWALIRGWALIRINTVHYFVLRFEELALCLVSIQPIFMSFVAISSSQVSHCFDAMSLVTTLPLNGLKGSQ